jgi:poly(A) polymerase
MSNAGQHAAEIVGALRERGHQAYFAGGCVRDLLLSREPADYDVATDATPQQVMEIFPQTFAVGEQFGVVLVPESSGATPTGAVQGGHHKGAIEVATFRSDVGYSDGRHPDEVRFERSARGCATPGFHHQRDDARSRD